MFPLREHARDEGVDHAVEYEVLGLRDARKQTCVPEQDMVEFVHHQHQELFWRFCVAFHETGVDQQAWLDATLDGSRRHLVALDHVHETKQGRQCIATAWEAVEDTFGENSHVGIPFVSAVQVNGTSRET